MTGADHRLRVLLTGGFAAPPDAASIRFWRERRPLEGAGGRWE